uniref:Uncharacterized protein n=1 Tax=Oryza glaberrima TaxID=4538 RepID=I1QIB7_ORYGL
RSFPFFSLYSHVRPSLPSADLPHRSFASQTLVPPTPSRPGDSIFPLPLSLHLGISRHHHLLLSPELSSCCRRSGHPSLSLRLPPPSPGARCSGTPSPTGVPTSRPPESRRPARPLLSLLSDQRSREEEEPPKNRRGNFTPSMETFAWSQTPTSNRWS